MTGESTQQRPTAATTQPSRTHPKWTSTALTEAIEVLPPKTDAKLTINFKVHETGALYRISPARDPRAPRLWCVSVRQCSAGGAPAAAGQTWIDRPGQTWAELAAVIEAIRADLGTWLATPARRDLCRWLLTEPPLPKPTSADVAMGRSATTSSH